jgi:hypothetical protein
MDVGLACRLGRSGHNFQSEMNESARRKAKSGESVPRVNQHGTTALSGINSILLARAISPVRNSAGNDPLPGINTTTAGLALCDGGRAAAVCASNRSYMRSNNAGQKTSAIE